MSDHPLGPGWWQASNGKYYPPEAKPDWTAPSSASTAGPWSTQGMDDYPTHHPPNYQHGPYAYGTRPPEQGTNGLAVASLVLSILGFCTCAVTSVVGVVLGHVALSQLGRPDNRQSGRGLAIAGLAVGYVVVGLGMLWFAFAILAGV